MLTLQGWTAEPAALDQHPDHSRQRGTGEAAIRGQPAGAEIMTHVMTCDSDPSLIR